MKKNIILILIYIVFSWYDIAMCEFLTLDQKIDIFMFCLNSEDQQFNNFLLENVIEIVNNIDLLNTEHQIELYARILEARFYKN